MPLSLSELLLRYPFEKRDDVASLAGLHGVFVAVCCQPHEGGIACHLLDFGGSVDLKYAIESSQANNRWRETCPSPVDIMVAVVTPMTCETLLKELQHLHKMDKKEP